MSNYDMSVLCNYYIEYLYVLKYMYRSLERVAVSLAIETKTIIFIICAYLERISRSYLNFILNVLCIFLSWWWHSL